MRLDTNQFKSRATAEQIQEDFTTLAPVEVYSTIAYYLQHRRIVEEYLAEQTDCAGKSVPKSSEISIPRNCVIGFGGGVAKARREGQEIHAGTPDR